MGLVNEQLSHSQISHSIIYSHETAAGQANLRMFVVTAKPCDDNDFFTKFLLYQLYSKSAKYSNKYSYYSPKLSFIVLIFPSRLASQSH